MCFSTKEFHIAIFPAMVPCLVPSSLVMDRPWSHTGLLARDPTASLEFKQRWRLELKNIICLLYTSDAADE